jgi:hypothetical protein
MALLAAARAPVFTRRTIACRARLAATFRSFTFGSRLSLWPGATFALLIVALALAFTPAFALTLRRLTLARRTLRRVRIALRPIATASAAAAATTTTVATTPRTIRIPRLIASAVFASVLRSRRTFRGAALGRGPIHGPHVLAITLGSATLPVSLRRTRLTGTIRTAPTLLLLLVAILIAAALRLGLALRPCALLRCCSARTLGLGTLLPVVGPATAASVVAEAALAFATRTVSVKLLLGTPGDFAAPGVVLRHERSG